MGLKFGRGFRFGFSTVGVQHEMGLPGSEFESDWVLWLRDFENIVAGVVSGDRAEDGPGYWHLFRDDHARAVSIGMDAAWITVEWARVFPKPTYDVRVPVERDSEGIKAVYIDYEHIRKLEAYANRDAVEHYREVLLDWRSRGGMVIGCLFHWSLPTWLHNPLAVRRLGVDRAPSGWVDERAVVEFTKFVAYIAHELDEAVDMWYTMNEPLVIARLGYIDIHSGFPPGYLSLEAYEAVVKHLVEAHARAYDTVKLFSKKPVGIVESVAWYTPHTEKDDDVAQRAFEDNLAVLDAVTRGVYRGPRSSFEREDLRNRLDWIGLNYYTRTVVRADAKALHGYRAVPGYGYLCSSGGVSGDGRPCSDFGWEVYPEGIYHTLKSLYNRYRLPIYITENGVADAEDRLRPRFIVSHLYWTHRALAEGVDVRGYFHWNLIDNLEWAKGYSMRFGLFHVDMETKKRYPRPSTYIFKEIAQQKEIPDELLHLVYPAKTRP